MDDLIDIKTFDGLTTSLNDSEFRKTVRLLCVFGNNGTEVILITTEDNVYCFGLNRNGCLGLGTFESANTQLVLNKNLSGKSLVDIVYGWDHCIGITPNGICYSWGNNEFGRLGIGTKDKIEIPHQIFELKNHIMVGIACGSHHTIGLTNNGKVYSWGRNDWGQLGLRHYKSRYFPNLVDIENKVVMISSGKHHSMALTKTEQVVIWGLNQCGQLGLHPNTSRRFDRDRPSIAKPQTLMNFSKCHCLTQVVCGPFYSMVLASDGSIFSFGENNVGQLGIGVTERSLKYNNPRLINANGIKFKEIIANNHNNLSMGVSVDNTGYVWGETKNMIISSPKCPPESLGLSMFEKYAKLAKNKMTFKTIIISKDKNKNNLESKINENPETNRTTDERRPQTTNGNAGHLNSNRKTVINFKDNTKDNQFKGNVCLNDKNSRLMSNDQNSNYLNETESTSNDLTNFDTKSIDSEDFMSCFTTVAKGTAVRKFQRLLSESFNSQESYDLVFDFGKQHVIYCHKTILKLRNKKFWQNCAKYLSEESKGNPLVFEVPLKPKVTVKTYTYKAFNLFIKYLYGFEPNLDKQIIDEVLRLATIYDEPELKDLCSQFIQRTEDTINVINVCDCYEKAINNSLHDLEMFCIEFVAKNWKTVCKSDAFQALNDSLSERLMTQIFQKK